MQLNTILCIGVMDVVVEEPVEHRTFSAAAEIGRKQASPRGISSRDTRR
jgi:hypothetical protein